MGSGFSILVAADQATNLPWWQVVTGALGIPATLITIYGGWRLSQKTRLESQKLQLELREKEREAAAEQASPEGAGDATRQLARITPASVVAIGDIVTRFVIFYLALSLWGLIEALIFPLWSYLVDKLDLYGSSSEVLTIGVRYVNVIIDLPRYVIFFLLGWPLLVDIARQLGLSPLDLIRRPAREREA
jgi:hypothetical protein